MEEDIRVYCAGPLFNDKEREEMRQIAEELSRAGFETFLPQRDGLEMSKCVERLVAGGMERAEANALLSRAVFKLDVYQVLENCQAMVVNLNGRVPDEGAVSEAAMAWSAGKAVVGYKADSRSVFEGADNPLVTGLFGFSLADSIGDAVSRLVELVEGGQSNLHQGTAHSAVLDAHLEEGGRIWEMLQNGLGAQGVAGFLRNSMETMTPKVRARA